MERAMGKHRNSCKDESGSPAAEYRMLVVTIAMAVIAASVAMLSKNLSTFF
jgi:Flp pilus assembly pilin Flp